MDHLATLTELRQARRGLGMLPPVRAVYQPVVDLRTRDVVGFEALARGPRGTEWEFPEPLFADARRHGVEAALDWECRAAAMSGAIRRRLPASIPLFLNTGAASLDVPVPAHVAGVVQHAAERLQLVVEVGERQLVRDPGGMLDVAEGLRATGWGVALDDVGGDPAGLALLPLLEPDVIKIDLNLVKHRSEAEVARLVDAVGVEAGRSGATVLAEGVETADDVGLALAMGASLGQGWYLGRPGPLPAEPRPAQHDHVFVRPATAGPGTPFELVARHGTPTTGGPDVVLPLSRQLEQHALETTAMPVLLRCFGSADRFTADTAARYRELTAHCAFVGALGTGMSPSPVPGVHGGALDDDDPLAGEWVVSVLDPDFAGVLAARERTGTDGVRRFELALSHDRDVVIGATRALLCRTAN